MAISTFFWATPSSQTFPSYVPMHLPCVFNSSSSTRQEQVRKGFARSAQRPFWNRRENPFIFYHPHGRELGWVSLNLDYFYYLAERPNFKDSWSIASEGVITCIVRILATEFQQQKPQDYMFTGMSHIIYSVWRTLRIAHVTTMEIMNGSEWT